MTETDLEQIAAARAAGPDGFKDLVGPYRRELLAHCYRMVGGLHDAEDLLQETLLRAWRNLDAFQGRASLRGWLYRIATNACLDHVEKHPRRGLPQSGRPPAEPGAALDGPVQDPVWLEPFPDAELADAPAGPEARYSQKQAIALAFMTALHLLPPKQRAVLILRDVLGWQASEVADALELTVASVNSAMQRARATLDQKAAPEVPMEVLEKPDLRSLLERYVRAWESGDVPGLVALLREDASLAMPPLPTWFKGREAIGSFLRAVLLAGDAVGRFRYLPTHANGQPAFGCYQQDPEAKLYRPLGVQVIGVADGVVTEVVTFLDPSLVARFGLPATLP